jgi:hypothetical protein
MTSAYTMYHSRLTTPPMTRSDFMSFFRDDEKLNTLSVDDRLEVFRTILTGSSDLTADLLNEVLRDYCAEGVMVAEGSSTHTEQAGNR